MVPMHDRVVATLLADREATLSRLALVRRARRELREARRQERRETKARGDRRRSAPADGRGAWKERGGSGERARRGTTGTAA